MKQQRDEVNIIRGEKNKMKSIKRRNLLTGISGTTRSSVISTPTKKKSLTYSKKMFSPKKKQVVVKKKK